MFLRSLKKGCGCGAPRGREIFFNTSLRTRECIIYAYWRHSPRVHMTTDPLESPDNTSPFCVNAKQVTYFGRSRVVSNIPLRLYRVPPASNVQKLMWPLPQVTIWLRSSGWNSAATTVSIEHYITYCTRKIQAIVGFRKNNKIIIMWKYGFL